MAARRFSSLQKATTLIPLAILSVAWTANVTDLTSSPTAEASNKPTSAPSPAPALPDGTQLPSAPLQKPASITAPQPASRPASATATRDLVARVSATGIPGTALAAYQRAATVINAADKTCHLDWTLLAAIGRVESNHGRFGGSHLTEAGLATPAVIGPALTGKKGSARVADSDGGQYDGDTKFDHAVGPMQFLPSTWAVVGVDADGDGKRDPQDINDAALATAVYLCSGSDLATAAGQRAAVFRYNHSKAYVATVLGVAAAYRAGDYTALPDTTPTGPLIISSTEPAGPPAKHGGKKQDSKKHGSTKQQGSDQKRQDQGAPAAASTAGSKLPGLPSPSKSTPPAAATHDDLVKACTTALETRFADQIGAAKAVDKGQIAAAEAAAATSCANALTSQLHPMPAKTDPAIGAAIKTALDDLADQFLGALPVTDDQRTDLCTSGFKDAFSDDPNAGDQDAWDAAVKATLPSCVSQLEGPTYAEAQGQVTDVVASLKDTFLAALNPEPSETPSSTPSGTPSPNPSATSSAKSSGSSSPTPSGSK